MIRKPRSGLLVVLASLLILSCSLSLNVNGPGGPEPTQTSVQDVVNVAVEKTLTALAQKIPADASASSAAPDGTQVARSVSTLVAGALLTLQPTQDAQLNQAPIETSAPVRQTRTLLPPTALPPTSTPLPSNTPAPTNTPLPTNTPAPTDTPLPTSTPLPTDTPTATSTPLPTNTPVPTSTPVPTDTPTFTPTFTPTPTDTSTPTRVPTHCPQQYCVILQRCEPGENTRAVGTIYENDRPKNGVRVRVSYAMGGPPVIPDFISGNDPNSPTLPNPLHPGYYQLGLLEGGALAGNWWVFIVDEEDEVISEGRLFNTQGQQTPSSCQVGITDFYR